MGTHGRSGLERYVLGSVAERVVNRATIPVLTVRAADDVTTSYPYTAVESGSVPREITSYADSEGIDLIVMGTHGRTWIDQHLLGSITERVLRTASVPVLTTNRKNPS